MMSFPKEWLWNLVTFDYHNRMTVKSETYQPDQKFQEPRTEALAIVQLPCAFSIRISIGSNHIFLQIFLFMINLERILVLSI